MIINITLSHQSHIYMMTDTDPSNASIKLGLLSDLNRSFFDDKIDVFNETCQLLSLAVGCSFSLAQQRK